ncbi:hypothetical protein P7C70_g7849, partial [Phenoliferia sp. Uapishka_3]
MAQFQNWRQLTLRERFELQAPFLPTESATTLYKPDQAHFDLVGNTATGNYGLQALPHKLERTPQWTVHIISTCSGIRGFCKLGAKLVVIPPEHPALGYFEPGFVTHMIEGGAEMDVHGKGKVHVELYGMGVDQWSNPQVQADFSQVELHGYASERLIEISVEGCGRLRARGLARLQELARRPGGLGITLGGQPLHEENNEDELPTYSPPPPSPPGYSSSSNATSSGEGVAGNTSGAQTDAAANGPTPVAPTPTVSTPGNATSLPEAGPVVPVLPLPVPTPQNSASASQPSARATAAAKAKQSAAHAQRRHASPPQGSRPQVITTGAPASGAAPPGTVKARQDEGSPRTDANSGASGSRKRKSTSPRINLRADTEELFNKSQKLRQTHDWRAENGPGGRTASDWRGQPPPRHTPYPATPSRLSPRAAPAAVERPARARQNNELPPRPSEEVLHHQHHLNQDCRGGRQGEEPWKNGASTGARPSRFDVDRMGFDNRTLNYGNPIPSNQAARPTPCQPVNLGPSDPRLSHRPIEVPSSMGSGRGMNEGITGQAGRTLHGPPTLAPPLPPFDRVISPPPHSNYSTRGHETRSQASDFFLPPPRNYTTSQLTRDPHRSLPPNYRDLFPRATYGHDETVSFTPVTTPMERSRPIELAAGGVELVDTNGRILRNSEVIGKLEEGQVVESKLDGEGWEVVGKKKASKPANPPANTPAAPVAGPSRLPPRRAAIGKSKLSTVFSADEDWVEDMETGSSGEFFHHRSQAQELTKTGRQNELDIVERKTRAQRRFKASQKRHWQEKLSKWEEYKKVNGGVNTRDARRKFWIVGSEL